ncbi:18533_t:CDS:2 [Funneliformis geosporum]|uniref:18533_t:CDS:1 n=1 Tax=Funneliformis geosporum TaxID=1117311 RepID=A0A9W4STS8_9GLOM|nr:18533_t:CDS:2 [Funneliformis geosporum]
MNFKKELSYDDDLKVEDYLKKSFTGNDRKHLPLPVIAQKIVRNGCTKDLLMMNVLSVFATVILFLPPSSVSPVVQIAVDVKNSAKLRLKCVSKSDSCVRTSNSEFENMCSCRFNTNAVVLYPDSIHRGEDQLIPTHHCAIYAAFFNSYSRIVGTCFPYRKPMY